MWAQERIVLQIKTQKAWIFTSKACLIYWGKNCILGWMKFIPLVLLGRVLHSLFKNGRFRNAHTQIKRGCGEAANATEYLDKIGCIKKSENLSGFI